MPPKNHSPPRPPRKPRLLRPITDWAPSRQDVANAFLQNSSPNRPISTDPPRPSTSTTTTTSSRRPPVAPRPRPAPSLKRKLQPDQRFIFLDGPPPPANSGSCPPPPRSKPKPTPLPIVDLTRSPSPPVTIPSSDSSSLFEIPTVFQKLRRARKQPPLAEPSAPQVDILSGFHRPKRSRNLPPIPERPASPSLNPSRSPSASQQPKRPKKHSRPSEPSSPTIEIPTVFQELRRARKLQRTGEPDARLSNPKPSSAPDRGPGPPQSTRLSSQRVAVPTPPSPATSPSPCPIPEPSLLAARKGTRELSTAAIVLTSSPPLEPDPLATPRARPPNLSAATNRAEYLPGSFEPECADDSFRTPKAGRHRLISNSPHMATSESTSSSAAHVASILLGRPPVLLPVTVTVTATATAAPPSPGPPPPRFLKADLKLLPIHLLKLGSALSTSCASLVVRPEPVPGLPADGSEVRHHLEDRWRIRRDLIGAQGGGRQIDCWALGHAGWPAKFFTVCGWLVGIDRRERSLTYYIDDGTAVLECQLPITRLDTIFEIIAGSQDPSSKTDAQSEQQQGPSSKGASLAKRPRSDPRLDAYRRLSPPRRAAASQGRLGAAVRVEAAPVNKSTVEHYATLSLGLTLMLTGQPREMFGGTKRVLDVERARLVTNVAEEIGFRNKLRELRRDKYCRPFRLANVWAEGPLAAIGADSPVGVRVSKEGRVEEQTVKASSRRLRLPPVRSLSKSDLTIAKFQSYLSHHILTVYSHLAGPAVIRPLDLLKDPEVRLFAERQGALEQASTDSQTGLFLGGDGRPKARRSLPEEIVRRAIRTLVNQGTLIVSPFDESVLSLPNVYTLGPVVKEILVERSQMRTDELLNRLRTDELWMYVLEEKVLEVLELVGEISKEDGLWRLKTDLSC